MKDIQARKGRFYITRLIEEGEHVHQDFKFSISDARKIAHSISAFANNDGGRLLIGVKDNGVVAGVRNEEDIYVVEQAATMYCRPAQQIEFQAYKVEDGAVVIIATVAKSETRPVEAQEADGRWRAYYRVKDENIVCHPLMAEAWKRQRDNSHICMSFTDTESRLLNAIDDSESVDVEEVMVKAHVSRGMAEEMITNLCSLEILEFQYINGRFRVVKPEK
jgi:predicted HTH transcriptional regulator